MWLGCTRDGIAAIPESKLFCAGKVGIASLAATNMHGSGFFTGLLAFYERTLFNML